MNASSEPEAEIDKLYKAWGDAFHRQDLQDILDLLTSDYVLWPAGSSPMTRDSLEPRLVATLSAYEVTPSFEREERLVTGDLAIERGWDIQRIRPRAGGEMKTHRQRVFLILRRGSDGKWRFARGMSQPGPTAYLIDEANPALCCKVSAHVHATPQSAGWLISFSLGVCTVLFHSHA
jgi:ketosteroid isomerase-like protein